jgi:hypothetical protein
MIMFGNMQRKIVELLLCVFMVPSFAQAMIITENGARGLAVIGAVASFGAMSQLPYAQEHVGGILAVGGFFGGMSYLYLREYTPVQISNRAEQTKKEIGHDALGALLFCEEEDKIARVNNIVAGYSGNYPLVKAVAKLDEWEVLLNKHQYWLDAAHISYSNEKIKPIKALQDIRAHIRTAQDFQTQVVNSNQGKKVALEEENTARENSKYTWMRLKWLIGLYFPKFVQITL